MFIFGFFCIDARAPCARSSQASRKEGFVIIIDHEVRMVVLIAVKHPSLVAYFNLRSLNLVNWVPF